MTDCLIVGTTSINRPEVHNIVFEQWIKWLKSSGKKIVWFINIDTIDTIDCLDSSYEETKENMIKLIKDNIDNIDEVIILPQQKNGFLGACKILSETIKKYVEDKNLCKETQKIIWLEDDWKIINDIDINKLLEYSGKYTHINLTGIQPNYIHALAPSILSYMFWETYFYTAWKHQVINICPEKCIGLYFYKINNINNMNVVPNYTIHTNLTNGVETINNFPHNSYIFIRTNPVMAVDVGIAYAKTKGYIKTSKKDVRNSPYVFYKKI